MELAIFAAFFLLAMCACLGIKKKRDAEKENSKKED